MFWELPGDSWKMMKGALGCLETARRKRSIWLKRPAFISAMTLDIGKNVVGEDGESASDRKEE
jgi:hypothetical protein